MQLRGPGDSAFLAKKQVAYLLAYFGAVDLYNGTHKPLKGLLNSGHVLAVLYLRTL
jgi:hypothetical protein